MKYIEMTINTSKDKKDIIEGILFDYGIYTTEEISSDIVDELDQDEKDWDFIDYPLLNSNEDIFALRVYPENMEDANNLKAELSEKKLGQCLVEEKDDEDWANNWKKYYKPLEIGEKLAIVPEWEDYDNDNRVVIKINPGMAFGTGTHESTYMCLELLERYVNKDDDIFDIGCGSGILAIAGLKLGAKKALAVDIDDKCIDASHENAGLNNLEDKVEIKKGNLLDVVKGRADLIVSNIIAEIIVDEIKNLKNHMEKGGIFITSGIIKERRQMVIHALEENGFEIIDELEKNNWVAIVGRLNV
ncbi:50S ribosomal protein L11 methyltransferase [Peptoniphilus harei]|uniref:Ribosomal protein L11 methyltransferase n=1 Tax=Peptoniphilus harei TaxID=54005 RepID=A0A2X1Y0P9_9FIRM|nr:MULTISPECIES: 50S ribosomal protein L11 methyltransferase [Peptoniphilus]MDU1177254.1 50S ribosomal protein L11 methyltransferase [Peptoniphilus harei]MDU1643424.1 50S ribosomal protein L11 methyltransferase [Peptoniphilus harei]MDU2374419.1 50S ribosomal protein L11 methyltransferase [Peptoniphilus harei]OFO60017.1 ribosomal protein L11 methyltransferase [Peptoniphilus sp. HMSC075B08]QQT90836.1 50S ribosomal protein L11 methyltransferase [Peptoniphilus harei]